MSSLSSPVFRRLATLSLLLALPFGAPASAQSLLDPKGMGAAVRADIAITELDVREARRILEDQDPGLPAIAIERGRLAIYEGDYDGAVAILSDPQLSRSAEGAELLEIAQASARATAGAKSFHDKDRGIFIRLQHDDDEELLPWLFDAADASRAQLERDLAVDLPRPLRIELVRDQLALSAMTGLPERAARTTGTVAVAKWGRVTMLSPRAFPRGYPWADTLAHELAHLVQTRASRDRAPLWLQEGVAKREEIRWRNRRKLDDFPPSDSIAKLGFERDLARPIDKLGASIAMLPSAEEARVAFAEVSSFVGYWVEHAGEGALPSLLARLKTAKGQDAVSAAMKEVSGASLEEWNAQWMGWLETRRVDVPLHLQPGGALPQVAKVRRHLQLGELLRERGHHAAAEKHLRTAHELAPHDALIRHHLAHTLEAQGKRDQAEPLVARIDDVDSELGPWFALNGRYARELGEEGAATTAFEVGVWLDPLEPEVACEGLVKGAVPSDPQKALLCKRARSRRRD